MKKVEGKTLGNVSKGQVNMGELALKGVEREVVGEPGQCRVSEGQKELRPHYQKVKWSSTG